MNAFVDPTQGTPGTTCIKNLAGNPVCWGDSGRNRFTGPGYFRTDMSVFKNTRLSERVNLQIGLEAFNIFNQDNALVPQANIDGSGGACGCHNQIFGTFTDTILPPRIVQYRAKVIF